MHNSGNNHGQNEALCNMIFFRKALEKQIEIPLFQIPIISFEWSLGMHIINITKYITAMKIYYIATIKIYVSRI